MAGIKEEEKPKEENEQINKGGKKEENNEIKIVENTINISTNERIKNTTVKKESKKNKIDIKDDEQKKALFPVKEIKKEEKKDMAKEIKDKDNNNISHNPFSFLVNKEKEKEAKPENNKVTSLFGNISNNNKSLFSNIDNNNNNKSLFDFPLKDKETANEGNKDTKDKKESKSIEDKSNTHSLFGNKSLFSNNTGKSLFGNSNPTNTPLLFSNINIPKNPFAEIKVDNFVNNIFTNKPENNQKNNENTLFERDDEGSDKSGEGDKPKTKYVAEPLKAQDFSEYSKLLNSNINNLFLYNKQEKKYISKGSGFLSIEQTKDEKGEKHQAVVVFRNHAGNKLVEGFLEPNFKKIDIINKDFNYVISFGILIMNEGKPDIGLIKIPFKNETYANELKESLEKALKYVENK